MSDERREPMQFPARVIRYGRDEPLPQRYDLRAGPMTAVLEGGDLRYVRLGEDQIVIRLYAAVRDSNWNTIEPRFLSYDVEQQDDGFTVRFVAEHAGGDVDFAWAGTITGTPDGVISATLDGVARKDFLRNRIGWCVLHPMEVAGVAATTETPEGTVEGRFPDLISPHQPFFDMQSISHSTPGGGEIVIRFEGDLWEMEDQRNWTDASYKSYSTPLRIPYPVQIHEGDRIRQTITIEGKGGEPAPRRSAGPVRVTVDPSGSQPLPAIGLGVASHGSRLGDEDIVLLRSLNLTHLHVALHLNDAGWQASLAQASAEAAALNAALAIEALGGSNEAGWSELASALSRSEVEIARVLVFGEGELDTSEPVLAAARGALAAAGVQTLVGGGTRAYFTELNRAALPLNLMDVVSYTINPQAHAFDNVSLTETLAAQPETVHSARAIVGDRPLVVGPITLKPPFNPNAAGPEPDPAPGELPAAVDERQPSLFAAGWLTGSLNALGNTSADALTYFETTGWRGVIERRDHPLRVSKFHSWPGMVFPVYHVLAEIGDFSGGEILPVALGDGLRLQALALRGGDRGRVILANMSDDQIDVALDIPGASSATIRRLDDRSMHLAATDPESFRASGEPIAAANGAIALALPPFGLATIDLTSGGA